MRESIGRTLDSLRAGETVEESVLENMLINVYRLLDSDQEDDYNLCLAAICHIADKVPSGTMVRQLLHDCIVKSRIFLYDDLLARQFDDFNPKVSVQDEFAKAFYTSRNTGMTLTGPQKEVFDLFQRHRRVVISAPTSFGKTHIISEIIAHNNYQNIALIMPTVSLLSEQYQTLRDSVEGYTISKSSKVEIHPDRKYMLILTPERMSIFLEEHPDFEIDFFVMDEIYKADYKLEDDRFHVFSDILYQLAKSGADFYLIGPYLSGFSEEFLRRFDVQLKVFNTEIVQKDYYHLDNTLGRGVHEIEGSNIRIIGDRAKNLLRLLTNDSIQGKFLIYRYQKRYVELQARSLLETWPVKHHDGDLVDYLSRTVSPEWDLVACIKRGVAFHNGAMPRHIQDLVVDAFNDDTISGVDYLFCTTSLTEGVNTSAKNVVLYDRKIGEGTDLKALDKKNIEGRAGRFMRHFVGRVFYLEEPEVDDDRLVVEIEGLDSFNPAPEVLLQMDASDLPAENVHKKDAITQRLSGLNIPEGLIKKNKFVSIEGQIAIVQLLRSSVVLMDSCRFDGTLPNSEQASAIMSIIYDNLFTDRNKGINFRNEVGKSVLIGLTKYYLYSQPTFAELLQSAEKVSTNVSTRIRYVFDLVSKYFEFIWPRYIKAFANLYNFVARENNVPTINLDMVVATLEYGTAETHEILLKDAGLPSEIIRKISGYFSACENFDDIQRVSRQNAQAILASVHPVEARVIHKYI